MSASATDSQIPQLPAGQDLPWGQAMLELIRLAAPTVAQMASYTVMQFLDTWMLAKLGAVAPTAARNAGMFSFAVISFGVGTLWVVNTLVSQSYGRKDYPQCGRYLWQGIWFGVMFSALALLLVPFATLLFKSFGHSSTMVPLEATYLRITVCASIVKMVSGTLSQFMLAINRPAIVLVSSVVGVAANVLAALILIFGKYGAPQMGVAGAAWAQNIGLTVELLVMVVFVVQPTIRKSFSAGDWRFRWREMKTLLTVGIPSGSQVVAEVLAWSLFLNWIMGFFGDKAMAANTFMLGYTLVAFMPALGIGTSITALVGRYIGMGRPDIAQKRAHMGFGLCASYMVICGVFFFIFRRQAIEAFSADEEVIRIGSTLMIFAGVYQLFDAMYINYNGALRGAGDTFIPALAVGVFNWGISVFGGYMVARHWKNLGPGGPWVAATTYGAVTGIFLFVRFWRGRWKLIHLNNGANSNVGFEVVNVGAGK